MNMFDTPFALGPNWHFGPEEQGEDGARAWLVLREDARGTVAVARVHELPAPSSRQSTRFLARDLEGRALGPERLTGPSGAPIDDVKRHKSD